MKLNAVLITNTAHVRFLPTAISWAVSGKTHPGAFLPTPAKGAPGPDPWDLERGKVGLLVVLWRGQWAMATARRIVDSSGQSSKVRTSRNGCPTCDSEDTVPYGYSRWSSWGVEPDVALVWNKNCTRKEGCQLVFVFLILKVEKSWSQAEINESTLILWFQNFHKEVWQVL